jgi:hypothetical protein
MALHREPRFLQINDMHGYLESHSLCGRQSCPLAVSYTMIAINCCGTASGAPVSRALRG